MPKNCLSICVLVSHEMFLLHHRHKWAFPAPLCPRHSTLLAHCLEQFECPLAVVGVDQQSHAIVVDVGEHDGGNLVDDAHLDAHTAQHGGGNFRLGGGSECGECHNLTIVVVCHKAVTVCWLLMLGSNIAKNILEKVVDGCKNSGE